MAREREAGVVGGETGEGGGGVHEGILGGVGAELVRSNTRYCRDVVVTAEEGRVLLLRYLL